MDEEEEASETYNLPMIGSKTWNKEDRLSNVITRVNGNVVMPTDEVVDMDEWRNFSLQLIYKNRNILDTPDGEKVIVKYQFRIFIGREVYETIVDAGEVDKIKWVKSATGGRAFIRKMKRHISFDEYVSNVIMSSVVSEKWIYSFNGWKKINGNAAYVHTSGVVGNLFPNVYGNPKALFEYDADKVGSYETFCSALGMLDICEEKNCHYPFF